MAINFLRKISSYFIPEHSDELEFKSVESVIGYKFHDHSLLVKAFTHRSYLSVSGGAAFDSNERLEFLGDAVLDLVITEFLYKALPETSEGTLSQMKSILVSRQVLAGISAGLQLGEFLLVNHGEEKTGGKNRPSNLANLYETILGAIYLDGGLANARSFIEDTLLADYQQVLKDKSLINYKSILLELAQSQAGSVPVYSLVEESGPDHEKKFVMDVKLNGSGQARASGKSKKLAEQRAAYQLLKKIAPHLLTPIENS
jgi:ribonuclease-3